MTEIFLGFTAQTAIGCPTVAQLTLFPRWSRSIWMTAWEQRKFSDVAVIRRGLTYSPTNIVDGADGVRVLRSSNINEDHFVLNDDNVFVDESAVNIDLVHDGDILITAANGSPRLVGKRARISDLPGKTVHGGFMLVASSPCSDFLCASMGSSWYRRFLATGVAGGNGAIGNLDSKALGETIIAVPNNAEIDKLGNFFTRLDSLITLHQRKCQYRSLYGYLSWEQRKLGEFSKKKTTKNADGALSETFTNSAEQGVISQLDYFDHDITNDANISGYYVVQPDDFVYNPRISVTAPCGPINRNRLNRAGVMSPLYAVFSVDTSVDKTYLEHYFKTSRWHDFMFLEGNTGARSDRFSISDATFFEMPIWCPEVSEQMAIAKQLETTDSLITLHQ